MPIDIVVAALVTNSWPVVVGAVVGAVATGPPSRRRTAVASRSWL